MGREENPECMGSSTGSAEQSPGRSKHFLWNLRAVCMCRGNRTDDRADTYKLQRQVLTVKIAVRIMAYLLE